MTDAKSLVGELSFRLRIDGADCGGFRECSGLDTSQDPIDYRVRSRAPELGGPAKHITLKAGQVVDGEVLAAWQAGLTGTTALGERPAKDLAIVLLDRAGRREIRRWRVRGARVVGWAGPHLAATGKPAAVDAVELVCEGVEAG